MDVIEINRRSVFSLEEAREVLPVVFRITKSYSQKVDVLLERLDGLNGVSGISGGKGENQVISLENQVNQLIQEWQGKMQKLGALPKGLWIADFDSGDGYYCWKFPERNIEFWHKYTDGYSKRIPVGEKTQLISLQERLKKKLMTPVIPISLSPTT